MTKISGINRAGVISVVIIGALAVTMSMGAISQGNNSTQNSATFPGNLVLNIYIDDGGKALITGYAESIDGLPFLKGSQYKYDNGTKQLYALTNSLTDKSGDDWESTLPIYGNYSEYHSIFYLPSDIRISKIDSTPGLEYLVSASNDSFQVDFHGYDVRSPAITIDYQIPLTDSAATVVTNKRSLMPLWAFAGLLLVSGILILWHRQRRAKEPLKEVFLPEGSRVSAKDLSGNIEKLPEETGTPGDKIETTTEVERATSYDYISADDGTTTSDNVLPISPEGALAGTEDNRNEPGEGPFKPERDQFEPDRTICETPKTDDDGERSVGIKITSEMAAVMETLTARERAVLNALIEHNGKMNQADIRFETGIPKSSLTGIVLSLERRKLIIKKEKGRTNSIELSEWFLSRKDSSGHDNDKTPDRPQ